MAGIGCYQYYVPVVMKIFPVCIFLIVGMLCGCSPQGTQPSRTPKKARLTELQAEARADPAGQHDIAGLPLIEVNSSSVRFGYMAFLITGDGGWEDADRALSRSLAASGVPVVALDWPRYCAERPTPEAAAATVADILTHYFSVWNQNKVLALGRSTGADALPFVLNRLPDSLLSHIAVVALLEPGSKTGLEFAISDWFGGGDRTSALPIRMEIEKLRAGTLYCFHGAQEAGAVCSGFDSKRMLIRALKAGNSPDVPYDAAGQEIIRKIRRHGASEEERQQSVL